MRLREWETEPDYKEFTICGMSLMYKPHKKKRFRKKFRKMNRKVRELITLQCEIGRVPDMLHLCGYVTVPQRHPLWGENAFKLDISVHGGLNYGRRHEEGFKFGFDCGHYMDYVPGMDIILNRFGSERPTNDIYRNMAYVTREVISLANQLLITKEEKNENVHKDSAQRKNYA